MAFEFEPEIDLHFEFQFKREFEFEREFELFELVNITSMRCIIMPGSPL